MRELAQEELAPAEVLIAALDRELKVLMLPKDAADEKNAILEVRAGIGGEEAALFAADLFRMYQRYAEIEGWRFEPLWVNETGIGGGADFFPIPIDPNSV